MDIELTKSAKHSISIIYKAYMERLSKGESKSRAKFFDADVYPHNEIIKIVREDIPELKRENLVKSYITGGFELTDEAITYMESKPVDTLKEWLSFGAQMLTNLL